MWTWYGKSVLFACSPHEQQHFGIDRPTAAYKQHHDKSEQLDSMLRVTHTDTILKIRTLTHSPVNRTRSVRELWHLSGVWAHSTFRSMPRSSVRSPEPSKFVWSVDMSIVRFHIHNYNFSLMTTHFGFAVYSIISKSARNIALTGNASKAGRKYLRI